MLNILEPNLALKVGKQFLKNYKVFLKIKFCIHFSIVLKVRFTRGCKTFLVGGKRCSQ